MQGKLRQYTEKMWSTIHNCTLAHIQLKTKSTEKHCLRVLQSCEWTMLILPYVLAHTAWLNNKIAHILYQKYNNPVFAVLQNLYDNKKEAFC